MTSTLRFFRRMWRAAMLACMLGVSFCSYLLFPSNRATRASKARWLQRCCARILKGIGVKVHVSGKAQAGSLLVSNHVSYLDILVLAATSPTVFVSKKEVRGWPVFGWFAAMSGTLFLDREKRGDVARVAEELSPVLQSGINIAMFLEGTSTDGTTVRPFKTSLLEPAVVAGWPVTPVAIVYQTEAGRSPENEICWWGDMTLAPHLLNLLTLREPVAKIALGTPCMNADCRKSLGLDLQSRVLEMHGALKASRGNFLEPAMSAGQG